MTDNNDKLKKIGIFDSGIGGLSLLGQLIKDFPGFEFHYIADNLAAPYGSKTKIEVEKRSTVIVDLLLDKDVDLIIVACNTATSLAIDYLRSHYEVEFVGIEPFVNALHKLNFDLSKDKIAILTTAAMFDSKRFKALLNKYDSDKVLTPLKVDNLASIIESLYKKGLHEDTLGILKTELKDLVHGKFTHAILGCTHYPLITEYFENILKIKTISPCPHVSNRVGSYFDADIKPTPIDYFWNLETESSHWVRCQKEDLLKPINF
jgi:glutamate racemase